MWQGILESNRDGIARALRRFHQSLSLISGLVSDQGVALAWERAAVRRRKMEPESLPKPRKRDLRGMIDEYDLQILSALARRIEAARRIGEIKRRQSAPVADPDREKRMLKRREDWAKSLNLPPDFVEELFAVILKHSTRIQAETERKAPLVSSKITEINEMPIE
ncbi:MAG: chorismate mutase [Acidobacteria bacterium]|nr:chorismate mutase [Acidobacteriota bacterium]